jgi:hypothetical protein
MCTAIHRTTCFETVTDDLAATTGTRRCQRVNCTFEAVKGHGLSSLYDLEGLVIVIATDIALRHWILRDATDAATTTPADSGFPVMRADQKAMVSSQTQVSKQLNS